MLDTRDPVTYLFVPADRPERFAKAMESGADRVIIDLEDAVLAKNKATARNAIAAASLDWDRVIVRINDIGSIHFEHDISLLHQVPAPVIMVPKVDGSAFLKRVDDALDNDRLFIPQIETVTSLYALPDILGTARVDRVAFGHLDFALDLGSGTDQAALAHVRAQIVLQSRLAGKPPPIDSVTEDFRDPDATFEDACAARNFGFGGKLLIHPAQLDPARRAFMPSSDDLAWAKKVLQALEDGGRGAVAVDGKMIDSPVEARARRILRLSDATGRVRGWGGDGDVADGQDMRREV